MSTKNISRRTMLGGAAAIGGLGAMGLSACSSDAEPGGGATTGTLRVGHYGWVGNLLADWIDDLTGKFEEEHPGVTVEMIPIASSEATSDALVQKLSLEARQGDSSYDLILGPTPWLEVGALVRAGAVLDVDEIVGGEFMSKFVEPAIKESTYADGKMYSIPFWADVVGFMDRPSMQAEAGVTPPETWDDVVAQVASGGLARDTYHYSADWSQLHRFFLPVLASYATDIFADNGTVDMSTPEVLTTLEIMKALIPGMPAAAMQPGKHLDAFYAGQTMSMSYWQTGVRGSVKNGIPADDVTYRHNLRGETEGTFFWDTSAVIPKGSNMAEMAGRFMTEGLSSDWGLEKSVTVSRTIPPMTHLTDLVELEPDQELAYTQLDTALGLPTNDAWLSVEQPAFKVAVERMMQEDLSASEVQQTLITEFAKYEA